MGLFNSITKAISGISNPVSALITGGASLLGGAMSNSASAKSVSDQTSFQQYMSNTSYQRAVEDMKAAGLNPMLAYSQGGASTPSGSSYTASDVVTPAVHSAQAASKLSPEVDLIRSQAYASKASGASADAQAAKAHIETDQIVRNSVSTRELNSALATKARADALTSLSVLPEKSLPSDFINVVKEIMAGFSEKTGRNSISGLTISPAKSSAKSLNLPADILQPPRVSQ